MSWNICDFHWFHCDFGSKRLNLSWTWAIWAEFHGFLWFSSDFLLISCLSETRRASSRRNFTWSSGFSGATSKGIAAQTRSATEPAPLTSLALSCHHRGQAQFQAQNICEKTNIHYLHYYCMHVNRFTLFTLLSLFIYSIFIYFIYILIPYDHIHIEEIM